MPARLKNGLKAWMLTYLGLCAALLAAGAAGGSTSVSAPADRLPEQFLVQKPFFLPPTEAGRRDDI